jgi:hypothetical protein
MNYRLLIINCLSKKITEEFGHCALQVNWMEKLGLLGDPRGE